jgi:hypothetical protein
MYARLSGNIEASRWSSPWRLLRKPRCEKLLKELGLDLPEGSIIHADKGYTDYHFEELLQEVGLHLKAQRKKRSKRPMAAWEESLSKPTGQYIETVFSNMSSLFARKIYAVTPEVSS